MHGTHIRPTDERKHSGLSRLDSAIARLRRFWESPAIRREFQRRLGTPIDISLIRTLRAIEQGGSEGSAVADVAGLLGVDASTASRLVNVVVSQGYATRGSAAQDRRRAQLFLTESGKQLLVMANEIRTGLLREITAGWSDEDLDVLARLLDRLGTAIHEFEPQQ